MRYSEHGKEDAVTDIIVRDLEPALLERIKQIGVARGLDMPQTLLELLQLGLHSCEGRGAPPLNQTESGALDAAIKALEQVPDDTGFALIGRVDPAQAE